MTSYYVVKLYTAYQDAFPDYLGLRRDADRKIVGLGVVNMMAAKHFVQRDEALDALKRFMIDFGGGRIVKGSVFSVTEELVDHYPAS